MSRMPRTTRRAQQRASRGPVCQPEVATRASESRWWWVKGLAGSTLLLGMGTMLMYAAVASVVQRPEPVAVPPTAPPVDTTQAPGQASPPPSAAQSPSTQPVAQEIAKLQYSIDQCKTWHNVQGSRKQDAIPIREGQTMALRAIRAYPELPWPLNPLKPLWNNHGYLLYGDRVILQFHRATGDNVNIVTAECNNTLSAAVAVRSAYTVELSADKAEAAAPQQVHLRARVKRWGAQPAAGLRVRFEARYADGSAAGEINGPGTADDTVVTGPNGEAQATLTPGALAGKVRLTASLLSPTGDGIEDTDQREIKLRRAH